MASELQGGFERGEDDGDDIEGELQGDRWEQLRESFKRRCEDDGCDAET